MVSLRSLLVLGTVSAMALCAQDNTGGITGFVTGPSHAVIPGVQVELWVAGSDSAFRQTRSDVNGAYIFKDLPQGIYELRAQTPGSKLTIISGMVPRSREILALPPLRLYGLPRPISVLTVQTGALASLHEPGSVEGSVDDVEGAAIARADVQLYGGTRETALKSARTTDSGHFVLTDVPPGEYELRIHAAGFKQTTLRSITVGSGGIVDVQSARLQVADLGGLEVIPLYPEKQPAKDKVTNKEN